MLSLNKASLERLAPGKMRRGRVIHWRGRGEKGQEILFSAALRAGKAGLRLENSRAPGPAPGKEKPRPSRRPEAVPSRREPQPHSGFPSPRPTRSLTTAPISLHHPHPRRRSGNPGLPAPPRRRDYGGAGAGRQQSRSGQASLFRPRGFPRQPGPCPHPAAPSCALLTRSSDPPPESSRSP